jgi:hypothetical protein
MDNSSQATELPPTILPSLAAGDSLAHCPKAAPDLQHSCGPSPLPALAPARPDRAGKAAATLWNYSAAHPLFTCSGLVDGHPGLSKPSDSRRELCCGSYSLCDSAVLATQLGTPRGRYDEHSCKIPSAWTQGLIEPVGERTNFRRLMPAGLTMAPDNLYMAPYLGLSLAPTATWNLHTTQPKYFVPTSNEVVNLTGLL